MALLDDVKLSLRITSSAFNTEVQDLISECKSDLELAGLLSVVETDPLVKRAIKAYCKANFGLDNKDSEKYMQSYESLKNKLSMTGKYAFFKIDFKAENQSVVVFDGEAKETDADGDVTFYSRAKNHVEYTKDGVTDYIDIAGNMTVGD